MDYDTKQEREILYGTLESLEHCFRDLRKRELTQDKYKHLGELASTLEYWFDKYVPAD